ncbi:MAG: DUF6485 family protein [Planctomycetota bacterium]
MECKKEQNLRFCSCSYPGCSRKGVCCECLQYHLQSQQLPGCCFSSFRAVVSPRQWKRPTTAALQLLQRRGSCDLVISG